MAKLTLLETDRLWIRVDSMDEYEQVFRLSTDEELMQTFGFPDRLALDQQKAKISGGMTTYRTDVCFFHLIDKTHNKVVGSFAYHNWYPMHRRSEIGYIITSEADRNKGYMREALKPIIEYGFDKLNLNRLEAMIHPDNTPSKRLVEAFGFIQEGLLIDRYIDNGIIGDALVYRLLKKEYQQTA